MPPARKKAVAAPALECGKADACGSSSRVESFNASRPDGEPVKVTRCIECGSHKVENDS
jgi:hypothetical protein